MINREGVNDHNVTMVLGVADSATSALIECVGTWTDAMEMEYGASK